MSTALNKQEIVSTRTLSVPRALAFEAHSNPEHLAAWWGPSGFTNTFQQFDFRPGGTWRLTMRGPDGAEFAMVKTFVEIAVPEKIVLDHSSPMHDFRMTMSFVESDAGTTITWHMLFESDPKFEQLQPIITQANEQNFDRLEAYLRESMAH